MLNLLRAPYPFYGFSARRVIGIIIIGLFVSFFLWFFQPFGTEGYVFPNKNAFLLGYGGVVAVTLILADLLSYGLIFKKMKRESWTVSKQVLVITSYFLCTIIACFFYKTWFFKEAFDWYNFAYFHLLGSSIAVFPISITVLIDYIIKLKNSQTVAQRINEQIEVEQTPIATSSLVLVAENEKDQLVISLDHLLYIQSADNYVEVVSWQDGKLEKSLLRGSLQRMEQQIEQPKIQRCHRSFIVNLAQVESVSGNAQGYKLHLPQAQVIPVARSKSKAILAQI